MLHNVTITVRVIDKVTLYRAARRAAKDRGMSRVEISEYLGTERKPDIDGCLRQLIDRTLPPPGTELF